MIKFNWSHFNNPMGWIEPTYRCQLSCLGCYRGCNKIKHGDDLSLDELKEQISWHKYNRNVKIISIGGGEPLLYDKIYDIIKYIKESNLKSLLYTNGILLDNKKINDLSNVGLNEININVSNHRESNINEFDIKEKYCNMLRNYKKIKLGFVNPISNLNIKKLNQYKDFYTKNSDIIKKVTFCNYKDNSIFNEKKYPELELSFDNLIFDIKNIFGIDFYAYLDKTQKDGKSWLFSINFYDKDNKKLIGSYIDKKSLLKFKNTYRQELILIDPPHFFKNKPSFCDGCPDSMIYNNYLLPSCMLERFKRGENIGQIKINI